LIQVFNQTLVMTFDDDFCTNRRSRVIKTSVTRKRQRRSNLYFHLFIDV
jgi:hypothetical protein